MARTFVRRYRGEEPVGFLHPALEPILRADPRGADLPGADPAYRRDVAGLGWEQADHLRRGMSHFGYGEMQQDAGVVRFWLPAAAGQWPRPDPVQQAETLWDQVLAFAGYGFNQGHATSYADVSYRCAYLKAHWPAAFLCARLANYGGFHHPAIYIAEAVRLGLTVRPPHVNHSDAHFSLGWEGTAGHPVDGAGPGARPAPGVGAGHQRPSGGGSRLPVCTTSRHGCPCSTKSCSTWSSAGRWKGWGRAGRRCWPRRSTPSGPAARCRWLLTLAGGTVEPETPAQRLAWEQHLLGQPVSVHPLELVAAHLPEHLPLRRLPDSTGRRVRWWVSACRAGPAARAFSWAMATPLSRPRRFALQGAAALAAAARAWAVARRRVGRLLAEGRTDRKAIGLLFLCRLGFRLQRRGDQAEHQAGHRRPVRQKAQRKAGRDNVD